MQPSVAERGRLQALAVGDGDGDDAAGLEQAGGLADRVAGLGQMLERVPEDHRRPFAAHVLQRVVADVRAVGSRSRPVASRPAMQCVEQRAVAGADVENRPGRGDRVEPRGRAGRGSGRAASPAKWNRGPARGGTRLRRPPPARPRRPRVGGRGPAAAAADPAPQPIGRRQRPRTRRSGWARRASYRGAVGGGRSRRGRVRRRGRLGERKSSGDRLGPRVRVAAMAAQQHVVEPLRPASERGAAAGAGRGRAACRACALGVEDPHVRGRAEEPAHLDALEDVAQRRPSSPGSNSTKW